ncbi:MAG: hypothetical protein EU530_02725 [Promethearchaeota archaeon]|nr:MAG: hypothetical protein EU530_02725 [Candidatus Lokiarchaeota archaeon]
MNLLKMPKIIYKLLLIGNPGSGKTGLINAYIQGTYKREYISGLGIDFTLKLKKCPMVPRLHCICMTL